MFIESEGEERNGAARHGRQDAGDGRLQKGNPTIQEERLPSSPPQRSMAILKFLKKIGAQLPPSWPKRRFRGESQNLN